MAQAGSFLSAYYIGPVLMSLPAGRLADRRGVLGTMVLGQAIIGAGLATAASVPSFAILMPVMMFAGTGYGMLNPTSAKAVIAWFPRRQRATVIGLKQVGLPLGGLVMPPLALGWRAAVLVAAIAIAVLAALTWFIYRDPPGRAGYATAWLGLALSTTVALGLLMPVRERRMAGS